MARAFRYRNFGVYVLVERGQRHHRPHAHVKNRGRRVASVDLFSMTLYDVTETLPGDLLDRIQEELAALLALWERLNEHD